MTTGGVDDLTDITIANFLPVREEEELPLSCVATAAENGYDNWRG
jgi:hypothetical protein